MEVNSIRSRRIRNAGGLSLHGGEKLPMNCNFVMDHNGFSSVGTQTPTDDPSFEFPEIFTPSPTMTRSPTSSNIGTQTELQPFRSGGATADSSVESTTGTEQARSRPRLFRRHSTGSDVYNFATSPTLVTAFGGAPFGMRGYLTNRMLSEDSQRVQMERAARQREDALYERSRESLEMIGQELRRIGDDFERVGSFRSRSGSVSRFIVNICERSRNRTTSSSSSS